MHAPISSRESGFDKFGWHAPDQCTSISSAELVFLVVGEPEEGIATNTQDQDENESKPGNRDRIDDEVVALKCVHERQPHEVAPCEVETEVLGRRRVRGFSVNGKERGESSRHARCRSCEDTSPRDRRSQRRRGTEGS